MNENCILIKVCWRKNEFPNGEKGIFPLFKIINVRQCAEVLSYIGIDYLRHDAVM